VVSGLSNCNWEYRISSQLLQHCCIPTSGFWG